MSHPPLVSSLVDVLLNGDEVAAGVTPEDSPLPLKKVSGNCGSCTLSSLKAALCLVHYSMAIQIKNLEKWQNVFKTS